MSGQVARSIDSWLLVLLVQPNYRRLANPRFVGGDGPGISIRITEMRQTGTLVAWMLGWATGATGGEERG